MENIENNTSGLASDFQAESQKQKKFAERLKNQRERIGLTQQDLATKIGISLTSIQNYESGRIPRGEHLISLAQVLTCSIDWLLTGIYPSDNRKQIHGNAQIAPAGAQQPGIVPEGEPQWMSPEAAPTMGYTLVPKVKARLSAGTGSLETEGEIVGRYAFKTDFLHRKGHPSKMVLMDVTGDSMEPILLDNDTVLIDESQREIISGGLFAVGIDQEVFVKYLHKIPGKLVLRSKNPEYDPIEVDMNGDLAESVRIVGRVVWSCREYVR